MTAYELACESLSPRFISICNLLQKLYKDQLSEQIFSEIFSKQHPLSVVKLSRTQKLSNTASTKTLNNASSGSTLMQSASMPVLRPTSSPMRDQKDQKVPPMLSNTAYAESAFALRNPQYEVPFVPVNQCVLSERVCPQHKNINDAVIMILSIEQCHDCPQHSSSLWHDESKYNSTADDVLLACVCALLAKADVLPTMLFAFKTKAPKKRLGALEAILSILIPNSKNPKAFLDSCGYNEANDSSNPWSVTVDTVNQGTWVHHVAHSKLQSRK